MPNYTSHAFDISGITLVISSAYPELYQSVFEISQVIQFLRRIQNKISLFDESGIISVIFSTYPELYQPLLYYILNKKYSNTYIVAKCNTIDY